MKRPIIILIGCDFGIGHSIYLESLISHRGIEIVDINDRKLKEEPLTFPIRNYDLNFIDPLIYRQEPRIKKPLWFQGSDNVDMRVSGKKQNIQYNQRAKLRNNKHKK